MNEYDLAVPWQNDIRIAWELGVALPEAKSEAMNDGAYDDFGAGVLALNVRHDPTAFGFVEYIHAFYCLGAFASSTYTTSAMRAASSGGTALPICLAISILVPLKTNESGKLWKRAASR